jgi:hypothetical protein
MPVNIRQNERYRNVAKSLMRKNVSGEKNVRGIFQPWQNGANRCRKKIESN